MNETNKANEANETNKANKANEETTTMHDNCKQVIMFHNNWCKFLKNLKGVMPEIAPVIKEAVAYYRLQSRIDFLREVITLLSSHIKYISDYDESIFSTDYTNPLGLTQLMLLPKMDFMQIWSYFDSEDFMEDQELCTTTKRSIFNHLQILYISANSALEQVSAFDVALEKQKEFMMNMLENMNLDETLKKRIEEMKANEQLQSANGESFDINKLGELFGEDNFVFQLAKEVSEEMGLGTGEVNNPMESITSLFANGSKKLKELIITLEEKLTNKVNSGEFSEEKMRADALKAKEKLSGIVGTIPGLGNLLSSDTVMSEFHEKYNTLSPADQEEFNRIPELLSKGSLSWSKEDQEYFAMYIKKHHPDFENVEELPQDTHTTSQKPKQKKQKKQQKRR